MLDVKVFVLKLDFYIVDNKADFCDVCLAPVGYLSSKTLNDFQPVSP